MYGYMRKYPNQIPWISGEGAQLGDAWWICVPSKEYHRLQRYDRKQIEDAFFVLSLTISNIPSEAIVHVSAVNRYRLYVNGKPVSFGPRKGDIYSYYYETLDISPFLTHGSNVIAAYVVSVSSRAMQIGQNKTMSSGSIISGLEATGFILEGTIDNISISTGIADWKVRLDESKQHHHFAFNDAHGSFENVDALKIPWGWNESPFISKDWISAEKLFRPGCNYYGQIRALPLISRPFAQMEETPINFLRQLRGRSDFIINFDDNGLAHIPPNTHASCILDAGVHTTAFLSTAWEGSGAAIRFTYSESMWLQDDSGRYYKACRDDINGFVIGSFDLIKTSNAGVYEPFWFRTFRFISVDVTTAENSLALQLPKMRRTGYPLNIRTHIYSSNKDIMWLWETSLRTLKNCMHETFEDCPYYEQYQYVMDSKLGMDFVYAISDDLKFPSATLWDFHSSLRPDGMISCSYPSNETQIIPGFSLQFIWMVERYYHHTADKAVVVFYRPTIDAILNYFDRHIGDTGLCEGLGYWEFADWSKEWNACHGRPDAIQHGPSTIFNLMYAWSLQLAARLMAETGRDGLSEEYNCRAQNILTRIDSLCWSDKHQMLMEAPSFNEFSQHAQILGVLTGLLSGKRGYNALNNMLSDKSTISCSLPWQYYLFRALERFGMYKEMRQRLDDFTKLQDFNFTTMPEWGFEGSRSDCHAWSAVPLYEITATILGVRPAEDGWNKILVQPNLLGYSDCKGDVITPHGVVHIEITATDYSTTLKLQTPHETIVVMPDARRYVLQAGSYFLRAENNEGFFGGTIAE